MKSEHESIRIKGFADGLEMETRYPYLLTMQFRTQDETRSVEYHRVIVEFDRANRDSGWVYRFRFQSAGPTPGVRDFDRWSEWVAVGQLICGVYSGISVPEADQIGVDRDIGKITIEVMVAESQSRPGFDIDVTVGFHTRVAWPDLKIKYGFGKEFQKHFLNAPMDGGALETALPSVNFRKLTERTKDMSRSICSEGESICALPEDIMRVTAAWTAGEYSADEFIAVLRVHGSEIGMPWFRIALRASPTELFNEAVLMVNEVDAPKG